MKEPLVSIVIPVYNGSRYMREAIDSALAQTYENIEVVVVNDGSNDNGQTREIALSYGDKIRYIEKENGGVSSALNAGIAQMRGEYFSWLSHDDVYAPTKVEHQVRLLHGKDRCVALCGMKTIDASSQVIGEAKALAGFANGQAESWSKALCALFSQDCFGGCCFLIPREVFAVCGLFEESLRYVQDQLMWARIFAGGYDLIYDPTPDVSGRVHGGQLTQTGIGLFHAESRRMSDMVIPDLLRLSTEENNCLYRYALYNATYNNPDIVERCIRDARERDLFRAGQVWTLRVRKQYGKLRPRLRKVYYRVFRKIKVD